MARVLVVDDERRTAEAVAELLQLAGYEVATAPNGVAALAAMRHDRPDALLLDYRMPLCDGMQTLAAMRADATLAAIPVILMSAAPSRSIPRGETWRAFLGKPFRQEALLAAVAGVLG